MSQVEPQHMGCPLVAGRYETDMLLLLKLKCFTKPLTAAFVVTGGTVE